MCFVWERFKWTGLIGTKTEPLRKNQLVPACHRKLVYFLPVT